MQKILKNKSGDTLNILNKEVANNGEYILPAGQWMKLHDSSATLALIEAGDIVINNGAIDLTPAEGLIWAKALSEKQTKNIIIVNKNNPTVEGEFSSIASAIVSITDSSSTNQYLIKVGPGIYNEPALVLPDFVSLMGESINSTIIDREPTIAASYDGLINVEGGGTDTLTVVCDLGGVAGNIAIVGDGVSTCSQLIGSGYTVSAGGDVVLKNLDEIAINGGIDGGIDHHIIDLGDESEVSFVTIQNSGIGYAALTTTRDIYYWEAHKVSIVNCDIGVLVEASSFGSECYLEYIDINGTYTNGIKVISRNDFTAYLAMENTYFYPTEFSGYHISVDGTYADLTMNTCGFEGIDTDSGILITNGARAHILSTFFNNILTCIYADTNGSNPHIGISGVTFHKCTTNLNISNTTACGHYDGYSDYLKTIVNDSCTFFITNKDDHIITVAKKGGDFTSIKAALLSISDSSGDNRYLVQVGPGIFTEDEMTIPAFTSITGATIQPSIIIPSGNNHNLFNLSNSCEVSFLTVKNIGTGYAAFSSINAGNFTQMHKVSIYDCDIGIYFKASTVDSNCYVEYVDINGTYTNAVYVKSENDYIAELNAENFYTFPDEVIDNKQIIVDGDEAKLEILSSGIYGDGGDTIVTVKNGASILLTGSRLQGADTGVHVPNIGHDPSINIDVVFECSTYDLNIEHPETLGAVTGSANINKVYVHPDSSLSLAYADHGEAGLVVLQSLYQGNRNDRMMNLSKLVRESSTMGKCTGGLITLSSGRILDVAAGTGFLLDATDLYIKEVEWDAAQVTIPANSERYIYVDTNGAVQMSSGMVDPRTNIRLGRAYADEDDIDFITNVPTNMVQHGNDVETMLRETLGGIFGSGCTTTENASTPYTLDVSDGSYYYGTVLISPTGSNTIEFETYWSDGSTGWNHEEDQTVVSNLKYDNGSGTLANISATSQVVTSTPGTFLGYHHWIQTINGVEYSYEGDLIPTASEVVSGLKDLINADSSCAVIATGTDTLILTAKVSGISFTHAENDHLTAVETTENEAYYAKHWLYLVGEEDRQKQFLIYSPDQYSSLDDARLAGVPITPPWIKQSVVPIASIIVQKGAVRIIEIRDERPRLGFTAAAAKEALKHGDLLDLNLDQHTQYLLASGTRAMSGALDMGTNNITNVGTVDGVDISAHASRHLPNGGDPLTTAAPSSIGLDNAIGIANSLSHSDHIHRVDNLTHSSLSPRLTSTASTTNGTLTLTSTSNFEHVITGTATGYKVKLPDATSLTKGWKFEVWNQSSQIITLVHSDNSTVFTVPALSLIQVTLETNSTAKGSWLTFRAFTGTATGILNYNVISSTPFSSSTRTPSYEVITGFTTTPVAGTYSIFYSASVYYTTTPKAHYWAIYKAGSVIADSLRQQDTAHSNQTMMDTTQTVTQVNGSQAIDVRVSCANTGTLTVNARSMILIRLGD